MIFILVESTEEEEVCSVLWVLLLLYLEIDIDAVHDWTNKQVITPIINVEISLTISIHCWGVIFITITILKVKQFVKTAINKQLSKWCLKNQISYFRIFKCYIKNVISTRQIRFNRRIFPYKRHSMGNSTAYDRVKKKRSDNQVSIRRKSNGDRRNKLRHRQSDFSYDTNTEQRKFFFLKIQNK